MSGSTVNPLFDAFQTARDAAQNYSVGENGMLQYNEEGLTSSKDPIDKAEALLVALSVALVRGETNNKIKRGGRGINKKYGSEIGVQRSKIIKLFNRTLSMCKNIPDEIARADYVRRLIVLTFQKRDIRGNYGGGERTLAYWLFIELNQHFPQTMCILIHELPNYGSWLDLNKIYEILYRDNIENRHNDNSTSKLNNEHLMNEILNAYAVQLQLDASTLDIPKKERGEDSTISLAAKWIPKEGRATDRFTKFTKALANIMFPHEFSNDFKNALNRLRRMIVRINSEIKTTEQLMCAKRFRDIEFRIVPGRCLNKFSKAWLDEDRKENRQHPRDEDRSSCRRNYQQFLKMVQDGQISAKGKSIFVHEIANEVRKSTWPIPEARRILLESQFNDHINAIRQYRDENGKTDMGDTIPIVDTSGSMEGDPMGCAIAVGVITSHFNSPSWQNYILTFTSEPTVIRLRYPRTEQEYNTNRDNHYRNYNDWYSNTNSSIYSDLGPFDQKQADRELTWLEKLRVCSRADWGGSTNFLKAFDCIFAMAMAAKVQLPSRIICITDMQFDQANSSTATWGTNSIISKTMKQNNIRWSNIDFREWNTALEIIVSMLNRTNVPGTNDYYKIPEFIFWNARGGHGGYATQADKKCTIMISGWSTSMLKLFLNDGELKNDNISENSSWEILEKTLSDDAYTQIRMLCVSVGEGLFKPLQELYTGSIIKMPKTVTHKSFIDKQNSDINNSIGWEAGSASICSVKPVIPVIQTKSQQSGNSNIHDIPSFIETRNTNQDILANTRIDNMEKKVNGLTESLNSIQGMLSLLLNNQKK